MENFHVQVPATATFGQVLNLYNERVVDKKYQLFDEALESVKYPLESVSVLDVSHLNSPNGKLKLIKDMYISNIGCRMQDPEITLDDIQA